MRKLTEAERKASSQLWKTAVIVFAIIASIGLYGTLRTAELEPIRSLAICVTYSVGLYHIMTTFMRGVFK